MDDAMMILCAIQEGHIILGHEAKTGIFLDPALARGTGEHRSFKIDLCRKDGIIDAQTRRLLTKLLRDRQPCLSERAERCVRVRRYTNSSTATR